MTGMRSKSCGKILRTRTSIRRLSGGIYIAPIRRDRDARDQVLSAWQQGGRLGESGSKEKRQREELFFGPGGRYGAAELRARASMLET